MLSTLGEEQKCLSYEISLLTTVNRTVIKEPYY